MGVGEGGGDELCYFALMDRPLQKAPFKQLAQACITCKNVSNIESALCVLFLLPCFPMADEFVSFQIFLFLVLLVFVIN
jgi:hypothetical protein